MASWADGPMVGRDELLDELAGYAGAAAGGAGSIVLLTGEAGIGKTSVVRAAAKQARELLDVTSGTCVPEQGAPPFWPWRVLVDLEPAGRYLEQDQAVGAMRFELLTALCDQVRGAVRDRPRLHIIEDLQWADAASVLLLARLGAAIAELPLLVMATMRTGEPGSPQLGDAIRDARRVCEVRELHELAEPDVAALIRTAGIEPDERLLELLRARTGGNPLLLTELLRAVPVHEPTGRRLDTLAGQVPARVADLVVQRLGRVPEAVADALVTAAVIGVEGDVVTLAAAHGAPIEAMVDLLEQARAARLLDVADAGLWRFRHGLVRDAVYGCVTGGQRAQCHAAALEALADGRPSPPPTLAHHALAALPVLDADRAVALAALAGETAFAQYAYEEAVAWFTRALAAAPPITAPRWRAELLVLCGEAHRQVGDISAARQAFLDAAALTDDPGLLARAALGYASPGADLGIAFRTEDTTTADLLMRAIAAQPGADTIAAVRLEARLAAELYFSDQPARSRELAYRAVERAGRLGGEHVLGIATAVAHDAFAVGQVPLAEQLHESARLLEWARATGSVSALLTAHRARVIDLLAAGDPAGAESEIVAFTRIAEPLRAPGYLWWAGLWSAMRALLEGRHDVAEERAVAAFGVGEAPFPSLAFTNLSFLLFFLRREQGRLAEMEQATRDYAASLADVPALRVALTFLLAEIGQVDEARSALAGFDADALERLHDRNWPASWFQLARAAWIVGDRGLAATLLEPRHHPSERCVQVSLATVCLGAADLGAAWLRHTVGDLDGADLCYRAAAGLNARMGARSWLAQTRADHGRMLLERGAAGDREEAAQLLDLARSAAAEIGLATIDTGPAEQPPAAGAQATFRRAGPVWELTFADRAVQLPDARGFRDLACLLARPGEAVSVLELVGGPGTEARAARGAPALDERARREIREQLRRLDDAEADAEAAGDGERAALVREQRQELAEAVARDLGLGGRTRRVGDPVERARKTVSKRIHRTIATIGHSHPELGRHLERSIDTGTWCAYRPAEQLDWQT
jgi:tetratricopeptide (TPR) repeat protein